MGVTTQHASVKIRVDTESFTSFLSWAEIQKNKKMGILIMVGVDLTH